MRSLFDDPAFVKHYDHVGAPQSRNPVGRDKAGFSLHAFPQARQNLLFRVRIDGGKSVIEQQNWRLQKNGAGNADSLLTNGLIG
jgi:hypothetical protein